jgi:hypothetical protein
LSWPYQANVINTLETMSSRMVYIPFIGFCFGAQN